MTEILNLTIIGGVDKDGVDEPIRSVEISRGAMVDIVGPTGRNVRIGAINLKVW